MFKQYFFKFAGSISIFFVIFLTLSVSAETTSNKIYDNLIQCYRTNTSTESWTENSLYVLLELIRKIEEAKPNSLDMRTLSVSIIHRLRIDGIERASNVRETEFLTPYRANGIMSPKFQILLKLISDIPGIVEFDEFLTPTELCTLHKLVSLGVEHYVRNDEAKTCPMKTRNWHGYENHNANNNKVHIFSDDRFYVVSNKISMCPIEKGVIKTKDYGTLSPGVVIGSIAAGLQPQRVPIKDFISFQVKQNPYENLETMTKRDTDKIRKLLSSLDTIDNIYASGLGGDLAEVCLYQSPYFRTNITIGMEGHWNDTDFSRVFYLSQNNLQRWEMTDSEILAGIDGFHLGEKIQTWVNRVRRMRLSQVLELYYSARGIPNILVENSNREKSEQLVVGSPSQNQRFFHPGSNAKLTNVFQDITVDRETFFNPSWYVINDNIESVCNRKQVLERISKPKLKEQTYFLAQILQYWTSTMGIADELIKSSCDAAVDKFFDYANNLVEKFPNCVKTSATNQRLSIDLTLIIDGSRTEYESLKLISMLSEAIDVSTYGSHISVIHGNTGEILVSRTNSVTKVFENFKHFKGEYPHSLSLSRCLSTLIYPFHGQIQEIPKPGVIGGNSRVVLVISQTQRITQDDFEDSKRMFEGSLLQFHDLYYVFLTNDVKTFEELINSVVGISDAKKEQYVIVDSSNLDPKSFLPSLTRALRKIPKRLTVPSCDQVKAARHPGDPNIIYYQYEDYATPNQGLSYRISPHYLENVPELRVQFQGFGYGNLIICSTRTANNMSCRNLIDESTLWFNITQPCQPDQLTTCPSVVFTVQLDSSSVKCSEYDCRFPDQVRFLIRTVNMQCQTDGSAALLLNVPIFVVIVPILVIKLIFNFRL